MSKQLNRSRILILIVVAMSVIPFAIAWLMARNPEWLSGKYTNHGQLIIPPVVTERSELTGFDTFSRENLTQLNGHWVMINIIPGKECNMDCLAAIHSSKQLRLMMGKDLTRIRRVVLLMKQVDPAQAAHWWADDLRLLRARPGMTLQEKILKIRGGKIPDGMLLLMDPFGNLMMQYEPGFDPYDVKADLKRLLRISQIG